MGRVIARGKTLNPYRFAMHVAWKRLQWDLNWESWRSRSRLRKLKNAYLNRRAVIVCNGPSLNSTRLDLLTDVFTFGLNKINLLFDRTSFRPSCIAAVNPLVIEQNREFYNQTDIPLFLDSFALCHVKRRKNVTFLHSSIQPEMAEDCTISIQQGYTVTFVAMQLAFHMGFRDIALIGCDHSFAVKGRPNELLVAESRDVCHFDERYFSGGQLWHMPDLAASEFYYSLAAKTYENAGGRIVNCTHGGKLEVFPRMDLREWLGQ